MWSAMMLRNGTTVFALFIIALALMLLFVWIPLDVHSGIIVTARRRTAIGDSLTPAIAAVVLLVGAVALLVERHRERTHGLSGEDLRFLGTIVVIGVASLALMRWAGPALMGLSGQDYRLLRADVPWKYTGFTLGGWSMAFGLITLAERRPTWRAALVAALAVAALIAVYDLPFDDLLLPPNGDV